MVTDTVTIPAGTRVVGEGWSVLAGKGPKFQNQYEPKVVFRVGEIGSTGITEVTDVVFTTVGPTAGAIVIEWNVGQPYGAQAGAGMWDSHIRHVGIHFYIGMLTTMSSLGLVEVSRQRIQPYISYNCLSVRWSTSYRDEVGGKRLSNIWREQLQPLLCSVHGAPHHVPCYRVF